MQERLEKLVTETRNPVSEHIDQASALEIARIINSEDQKVAMAVEKELEPISRGIEVIAQQIQRGGRLIYCGAGTSGRLGILDAVECPPTYGVSPDLVVGLIAGGNGAIYKAVEGAEDSPELGVADLKNIAFCNKDVLVGIAASGRTPYVIGALQYARSIGAATIAVTCNPDSEISKLADIPIAPVVGHEVVTGSTRMKAGTAQKMVLNMLSTGAMIRVGKVYGNLMVDLKATNIKLVERAKRIISEVTGATYEQASAALEAAGNDARLAIVIHKTGLDAQKALELLKQNDGSLSKVFNELK